jgi:hypothetical protein
MTPKVHNGNNFQERERKEKKNEKKLDIIG